MRVAIVAHNALGALKGGDGRHIGGVERQTSLLAKWLAGRGHRVHVLVWDEGQGSTVEIDRVTVLPICREEAGVPIVRFFVPRWTALLRALRAADADVYYHNGAEYVTGQIAMWCKRRGRAFVFSSASDLDCESPPGHLTTWRERTLYRRGIELADRVVVQTTAQQRALRANYSRDSIVLPMGALDPFVDRTPDLVRPMQPLRVGWVGRLSREKRLEWLLEIAAAEPHVTFEVVGGADRDVEYAEELRKRAAALPNIVFHGRLSPDGVRDVYRRVHALCCTSAYEGFPNTFLEAWAHGVPVISTVDPDDVLETFSVGRLARDIEAFHAALAEMAGNIAAWSAVSERCRSFFLSRFAADASFARFETLFADVCAASPPVAP